MKSTLRMELQRIDRRLAQRTPEPPVRYLSPSVFARERLHFVSDEWQQRVLEWDGRRLLLCCARQTGKSTVSAIKALHQSLFFPGSLTLLISPSLRQSSELFRRVTDLLALLPVRPTLTEDNRLSLRLQNGSRIVSLPSSEPTIRGFSSVALVVIDEAARVSDSLYYTLKPMVAVSAGTVMCLSTPWGRRGFFHQEWTDGQGWEKIRITAEQCPRISAEFLQEERATMPAQVFASEYDCEFTDNEMNVFRYEDIQAALVNDVQPLWPIEDDFAAMIRRNQEGRAG